MSAFKPVYISPETSAKLSGNSTSPDSSLEGSPVDVRVAQRKALILKKKQDVADTRNRTVLFPPFFIRKRIREQVLLSDEEAWAADEVNAKEAAEAAASALTEAATSVRAKAAASARAEAAASARAEAAASALTEAAAETADKTTTDTEKEEAAWAELEALSKKRKF